LDPARRGQGRELSTPDSSCEGMPNPSMKCGWSIKVPQVRKVQRQGRTVFEKADH
jgi:hypothetical protein